MNCKTTYNPVRRLTHWQRVQAWAWAAYGVDAGKMIGTMVSAFIGVVVLGCMALYML